MIAAADARTRGRSGERGRCALRAAGPADTRRRPPAVAGHPDPRTAGTACLAGEPVLRGSGLPATRPSSRRSSRSRPRVFGAAARRRGVNPSWRPSGGHRASRLAWRGPGLVRRGRAVGSTPCRGAGFAGATAVRRRLRPRAPRGLGPNRVPRTGRLPMCRFAAPPGTVPRRHSRLGRVGRAVGLRGLRRLAAAAAPGRGPDHRWASPVRQRSGAARPLGRASVRLREVQN